MHGSAIFLFQLLIYSFIHSFIMIHSLDQLLIFLCINLLMILVSYIALPQMKKTLNLKYKYHLLRHKDELNTF